MANTARGSRLSGTSPEQLRPTAYLDGLRGFAAFLVYWHHHQLWAHLPPQAAALESSFGFNGRHYFATLPGIRILFNGGHFAVAAFFVISGYVLSAKPLSLIHAGDQAGLADSLASALFRRWFRLFLPIICTTFVYMTLHQALGIWIDGLPLRPSYLRAVLDWSAEMMRFSFVFRADKSAVLSHNFHLWSIPVEFRGSLVIYTALLAFSRCGRNTRLWCEAALVFYLLCLVDDAHYALFAAGMLLRDLDQLAAADDLPPFLDDLLRRPRRPLGLSWAPLLLLALSVYLGGCPARIADVADMRRNPGWYLLSFLVPAPLSDAKWFFLFWAAVLLVGSLPHLPRLRRFFETPFCQHLGRVSYALYLVHGPVLSTLGDRLYAAVGWPGAGRSYNLPGWVNLFPLPMSGPIGLELAFLAPHLILLPITLYLAELVTKAVDEPSVRFAHWLYNKVASAPPPAGLPA
ncbi:hypothetical protein MYCTH_2305381 [Thermothelomyces thermophilus ATCC 42464]|uniref:Acyltransferase 3 domain-containing protein n=1 Tax=Thermothelomyces thermophilus (strain ATCC 42464 / BCRC 31852 / DSM 1799) TaxID=573729 RepID=G2QCR6_THET4|nr:uncharacterized protein MYCTH_2305381 [Thermothelomyces thermophilus ATCC 42464]AEO58188.1 hypothetical protein MYCTH_2305381 [Thermothelomyces thermophilus ATCC 42464]